MSKYKPRFFNDPDINTSGHHLVGLIWPVQGSKGNQYDVEMSDRGFNCSCPGFGFHGKCKHIRSIVDQLVGDENE